MKEKELHVAGSISNNKRGYVYWQPNLETKGKLYQRC